jgi:hypothetical protein
MYFVSNAVVTLKLHATICGVRDLSIVKGVSLFDLLLNDGKCVH